jgi:multiple sugar transport system substrate-binding protein
MTMRSINRRKLVGSAAVTGAAIGAGLPALGRAAAAQDEPTEIVFSHIWGTPPGEAAKDQKHPAEQLIDAFNAQSTDVKVVSRTDSGNYYEVLQKAQAELAAGDPPALVITPWASINYAYEGLGVVPLEDIAGDEVAEVFGNLREEVVPLVQLEDKTVGVPFAFSCPVIYYNNDILSAAGVDPAALFESWAGLLEQGPTVQESIDGNPVIGFGTNLDWPAQSIIQSNGGAVMSEDQQPVMDSAEAVAAMQAIADLDTAGLYDRSTTSETRASFVAGSIACWVGSIASLGGLTRDVSFDLQTAPFPVFEGKDRKMSSGGSFIGVYARDEAQQQAAWEFLKFALSEPGYTIWMQTGYLNATTYDIPQLEGQEAAYTQLEEGLSRETAWPTARGGELQSIWGNYVSRIWANDIGAEEGCGSAVEEISSVIESA